MRVLTSFWSRTGVGRTPALKRRRPMGTAGVENRFYFEYSSTMSCSCTGAATSRRSGLRSTLAVSDS